MAAVYPELQLSWQGKDYRIKPTMALLNRLEQHFSLARLAHRIVTGDTPLSHMAVMVGEMLRFAGAQVTDDEVLEQLLTGDQDAVHEMALALITAAFPMTTAQARGGGEGRGEEDDPGGKPKAARRQS